MPAAPQRVLVTGASGQLGRALSQLLGPRLAWSGGRGELDVTDAAAVSRKLAEIQPDAVVNASAYNKVDAAETEAGAALAANAAGPANLARACREHGALLVHVSTDYVFDGTAREPYSEQDLARPLGVYGASKLAGEILVAAAGCEYVLVRTSGVFGAGGSLAKGGSFVDRILARARGGQPLRVVSDQVFSPTYAPDLATAILALLDAGQRGLFHVTNAGTCSWHGFAVAALRAVGIAVPVEAIRAADLGLAARRPAFSVLSNARYESAGLAALRPWDQALAEFLARSQASAPGASA
jgi:dTDP-4-dehydrorhamnose reductase